MRRSYYDICKRRKITGKDQRLGAIGKDAEGRRTRLAASDTEKQGRDLVSKWMKEAGLEVVVDRIGNIFGIWETPENKDQAPLMIGSHIDTVSMLDSMTDVWV